MSDAKSSEDQKVLTLAEQFIAAMPARIKNESETEPMHLDGSSPLPFDASQSDDLGIESMADELDLEFDFSLDETYRLKSVSCLESSILCFEVALSLPFFKQICKLNLKETSQTFRFQLSGHLHTVVGVAWLLLPSLPPPHR